MAITSYRDLRVWQAGIDLVERTYRVSTQFPREEMFGLTSQMRRAAVSVPSNIAEGHTREYLKEYLQHVSVAQSSLAELDTHTEIARRLGYCPSEESIQLTTDISSLGRQLYALRNALREHRPERKSSRRKS